MACRKLRIHDGGLYKFEHGPCGDVPSADRELCRRFWKLIRKAAGIDFWSNHVGDAAVSVEISMKSSF